MSPPSHLGLLILTLAAASTACSGSEPGSEPGEGDENLVAGCDAATRGDHYEFLDDVCKKKKQPSDTTRFLGCPNVATTASPTIAGTGRVVDYKLAEATGVVDAAALKGIVPDDVRVTLIMLRRVNGQVYARYLSNGTQAATFYPWSSTTFMAAATAATTLRKASGGKAGLDARVAFEGRSVPLGDVVTAIANYDESHGLSSNLSAKYFWNVGGRAFGNTLIHGWLGRPAAETVGANYGQGDQGLPYSFTAPDGTSFSVTPDTTTGETTLSTLTMAEFMKRLVTHVDVGGTRLPGLQKKDVETLLYGAETSAFYPRQPGGLSADTAIYVYNALDRAKVEASSRGKWRTFGKLGYGQSRDGTTNFVHNSYTCLPVLDATGKPVPDAGREFVLSVRLAAPVGTDRETDRKLGAAVARLVARIADGSVK
jgi:hypothetical protein